MTVFSDWFAMQQNQAGMLDYYMQCNISSFFLVIVRLGVRQSVENSDQNCNQIYYIERDQLPRLDYNDVMNQSKESNVYLSVTN